MSYFNCRVKYEKEINQSGTMRIVIENYLVEADSFSEAEARLTQHLEGRGDFIVESVGKMKLYDLFLDLKSERYYKCKMGFITLDEKAGVEKKKYVQMLVQADDLSQALGNLEKGMDNTLGDWEVSAIVETNFIDVLEL